MSSATYLSPSSNPVPSRPSILRSLSSTSSVTSNTKRNKPRLYLALYARGTGTGSSSSSDCYTTPLTCPSYHWTFIIGPQTSARSDPGTCLQVVHSAGQSWYEEVDLSSQTPMQARSLLLRITLAKVRDEEAVKSTIRNLASKTSCACRPIDRSSTVSLSSSTDRSSDRGISQDDDHGQGNTHDSDTCPHTSCLAWLRHTYRQLFSPTVQSSRMLKTYLGAQDWPEIEECARKYAKKKRNQGRFHNLGMGMNRGGGQGDGLGGHTEWGEDDVATWNFWENREVTA